MTMPYGDSTQTCRNENENENFQNNFRMISNVFDFMNMRKHAGNKHNCPENNNPVSTKLSWQQS